MFPPKPLDIFSPEGGCSEGLDAFRFFLKIRVRYFVLYMIPCLPLPGWAETRQWAYNTQRPLYKDGDTSPSLVLTGSLGLTDRSYRDREIGVSPVGPTLAAAWG